MNWNGIEMSWTMLNWSETVWSYNEVTAEYRYNAILMQPVACIEQNWKKQKTRRAYGYIYG